MIPFDAAKLERLMAEQEVDVVLASTRHNIRYLTGGYHYHFFLRGTRQANGQYLALVGVPRDVRSAFYVGRANEAEDIEAQGGLWIDERHWFVPGPGITVRAAEAAALAIRRQGKSGGTIGVELPFLPADAFLALRRELPEARLVDATPLLGELRAVKRPQEIERLREVHRVTAEAIRAALQAGSAEQTTREVHAGLARGVVARGANFLYSYTNVGPGLLRAPSDQRWGRGNPLHLDAGAESGEYVSDICRMGSVGELPGAAAEMYACCLEVADRLRAEVGAGMACDELHRLGESLIHATRWGEYGAFLAHGLGMVSHEPPQVDGASRRALEPGMVLSIETEFKQAGVGHIKYEDSIAVTPTGCEGLGDVVREWCVA